MERDFRLRSEAGFSIVELLTVMVIIGLLAAIAVPAFFLQRDRALDSRAMADARAAQSAALSAELGTGDGDGDAGPFTVASLTAADGSLEGANLTVESARDGAFTVTVRSETGNAFEITQYPDGGADLTCASADSAGCPADGTWE